jgi:hypothetical protein
MRTISVLVLQAASSSGLAERCPDRRHVFVRLVVGGKRAALFETTNLLRQLFVDVPGCNERSEMARVICGCLISAANLLPLTLC